MNTLTTEQLRELDAWIAEKWMGWRKANSMLEMNAGEFCFGIKHTASVWTRYDDGGKAHMFRPTEDPTASMMLLKKVAQACDEKSQYLTIDPLGKETWRVSSVEFFSANEYADRLEEVAPTLELAIAQFARKLKEKE